MSYTEHSMMANAEKHFQAAEKAFEYAEAACTDEGFSMQSHKAAAHAQAGLLAVELAKYAGR